MKIEKVTHDKKRYLPLLLLADEQESMIDGYLERGTLYILQDDGVQAVCVVTDEGNGILEIKNLATSPTSQRKGYGGLMMDSIVENYKNAFHTVRVGTGDSPLTLPFYEKNGFVKSHVIKDFFIDNYDKPIFEARKQLIDMIYLERKI